MTAINDSSENHNPECAWNMAMARSLSANFGNPISFSGELEVRDDIFIF